jgi:hypothetical protein
MIRKLKKKTNIDRVPQYERDCCISLKQARSGMDKCSLNQERCTGAL